MMQVNMLRELTFIIEKKYKQKVSFAEVKNGFLANRVLGPSVELGQLKCFHVWAKK